MSQDLTAQRSYTVEDNKNTLIVKSVNKNSPQVMEVILFKDEIIKKLKAYEERKKLSSLEHFSIIEKILILIKNRL